MNLLKVKLSTKSKGIFTCENTGRKAGICYTDHMIEQARDFAIQAHDSQIYGIDFPYSWHLEKVATLAERLGYPEEVVAACWLHDTVEDTGVTADQLRELFPEVVVKAVLAVTYSKDSGEDKIEKAMSDPIGHVVKYCDASVNFSASVLYGPRPGASQYEGAVERYPVYVKKLHENLPTPPEIQLLLGRYAS